MRNLPKHLAGLNLNYSFLKLFSKADKGGISLSITEMDGVKTADGRKYALDVAYGRIPYDAEKNSYPVVTSAVIKVGVYADYNILSDLRFFIQGSNILNNYRYEYSSNNPTQGATWLFGFKYGFTAQNK